MTSMGIAANTTTDTDNIASLLRKFSPEMPMNVPISATSAI